MTARSPDRSYAARSVALDADVLVLGGGPAGCWAAMAARAGGARVVIVDKGVCGASGATAATAMSVWTAPQDPASREVAIGKREALGGFLSDRRWSRRVLGATHDAMSLLAERGYPFPQDDGDARPKAALYGPFYMQLMRKLAAEAGVMILDQHPALELMVDASGAVAGARGMRSARGDVWTITAGAVVIATGGCAFLSRMLGCNGLTGDGLLMAAEAGADFSGMEFSSAYAISAAFAPVDRTAPFVHATFTDPAGARIPGANSQAGRSVIARWLLKGPVYATLDGVDETGRAAMRASQPGFFAPFDRVGVDPFEKRFPVTLRLGGTVRGAGGLKIVDDGCATSVPGLYAAGDAATRELVTGATTGAGGQNAAWAISSGQWAGSAAADYGRRAARGRRALRGAGQAVVSDAHGRAFCPATVAEIVKDEVHPFRRNYFRSAENLEGSLNRLDALWQTIRGAGTTSRDRLVGAREAAAMTAVARWMYRGALARDETRGMHRRVDRPRTEQAQQGRIIVGGLDEVFVETHAAPAAADRPRVEIAA